MVLDFRIPLVTTHISDPVHLTSVSDYEFRLTLVRTFSKEAGETTEKQRRKTSVWG